jgi:hypothetical protein
VTENTKSPKDSWVSALTTFLVLRTVEILAGIAVVSLYAWFAPPNKIPQDFAAMPHPVAAILTACSIVFFYYVFTVYWIISPAFIFPILLKDKRPRRILLAICNGGAFALSGAALFLFFPFFVFGILSGFCGY